MQMAARQRTRPIPPKRLTGHGNGTGEDATLYAVSTTGRDRPADAHRPPRRTSLATPWASLSRLPTPCNTYEVGAYLASRPLPADRGARPMIGEKPKEGTAPGRDAGSCLLHASRMESAPHDDDEEAAVRHTHEVGASTGKFHYIKEGGCFLGGGPPRSWRPPCIYGGVPMGIFYSARGDMALWEATSVA